jgi:hypothetical protein
VLVCVWLELILHLFVTFEWVVFSLDNIILFIAMSNVGDDFQRLLRDSLSLVSHIDTGGVPSIQRNLTQLDVASRKLVRQHTKHDANVQAEA